MWEKSVIQMALQEAEVALAAQGLMSSEAEKKNNVISL